MPSLLMLICTFFFFTDTPTTEIYTLSLHDALPISLLSRLLTLLVILTMPLFLARLTLIPIKSLSICIRVDRKSGSAGMPRPISYAVFCLKKKKEKDANDIPALAVTNKEANGTPTTGQHLSTQRL